MILTDLPQGTVGYRAHDPKWAIAPTSGAGAAKAGGRFNRPGIEALYLSLEDVTALREYQQTSPLLPPCTICSYRIAISDAVDLRKLHRGPPWDDLWHDWATDWRQHVIDRRLVTDHFRLIARSQPERWALHKLRKFTGWYTHGLPNGRKLRHQINQLPDVASFLAAVEAFSDDLERTEAVRAA